MGENLNVEKALELKYMNQIERRKKKLNTLREREREREREMDKQLWKKEKRKMM